MQCLQGNIGLQDRECMMHSNQCPTQSTPQAHKDLILTPSQCRQGNTAPRDKECNSRRHLFLARNTSQQDTTRRQRRLRSREGSTFLQGRASKLELRHCPQSKTIPEGRDQNPKMMWWPASKIDQQGTEHNSRRPGVNMTLLCKGHKKMHQLRKMFLLNRQLVQRWHQHNNSLRDTTNSSHSLLNNIPRNKESN